MKRIRLTAVIAGAALAASIAGPTLAADSHNSTLTAAVNAGTLTFSPAPSDVSFGAITLDGKAITMTGKVTDFGVVDATGSGAGYSVQFQASAFVDAAGDQLPVNSLTIGTGSAAVTVGSPTDSAVPVWTGTGHTIDGGAPSKILSAGLGYGMGSYTISQADMTLAIPASVKAGAYSATLVATLTVAP
jgi:WxL domain surface cell wall-binding